MYTEVRVRKSDILSLAYTKFKSEIIVRRISCINKQFKLANVKLVIVVKAVRYTLRKMTEMPETIIKKYFDSPKNC